MQKYEIDTSKCQHIVTINPSYRYNVLALAKLAQTTIWISTERRVFVVWKQGITRHKTLSYGCNTFVSSLFSEYTMSYEQITNYLGEKQILFSPTHAPQLKRATYPAVTLSIESLRKAIETSKRFALCIHSTIMAPCWNRILEHPSRGSRNRALSRCELCKKPDYFDPQNIVGLAIEGGCNAVATNYGVLVSLLESLHTKSHSSSRLTTTSFSHT